MTTAAAHAAMKIRTAAEQAHLLEHETAMRADFAAERTHAPDGRRSGMYIVRQVPSVDMLANGFTELIATDTAGVRVRIRISAANAWHLGAMMCGLEPLETGSV